MVFQEWNVGLSSYFVGCFPLNIDDATNNTSNRYLDFFDKEFFIFDAYQKYTLEEIMCLIGSSLQEINLLNCTW
jgi:hypothetical protein